MKHREQLRPLSFDEQRALEDLQKLHRDIQRARGDREEAEAEFDSFVRSFRTPAAQPAPVGREPRPAPAVVARETRPEPAAPAAPPPSPPAPPVVAAAPPPRVEPAPQIASAPPRPVEPRPEPAPPLRTPSQEEAPPFVPVAVPAPADAAPAPAPAAKRRIAPVAALAIGAVAVAALVFLFSGTASEPEVVRDVPAGAAPQSSEAAPQPEPAAPVQTPVAAAPETGVNLELITRRTVWVRVTVDGRRAIERELPGGERIPLRAQESIVIRAGDAGAVSVRRNSGAEVRFGEDGFPATRTFTAERRGEGTAR